MGSPSWRLLLRLVLVVLAGCIQHTCSTCNVSCPMCPCFASARYEVTISESSPIGTSVFTVTADDPNGDLLAYSLVSTSSFMIDNSGQIIVSSELDYELISLHEFQVRASDNDGFDLADVAVTLINEDDNAPTCNESIVVFSIREGDTSVNLGPLVCSDVDSPTGVVYTIVFGNESGIFFVDAQGLITLSQALDYEAATFHQLQITVFDTLGAANALDATVLVILQVQPLNEYPPVFSSSMYVCSVSEATAVGSVVCVVSASDSDDGNDGFVDFTFDAANANVNELEFFHIDLGNISLIRELDFETVTSYELMVIASDLSLEENARLSSTAMVVIDVVDANDNSPIFPQDVYYVEVSENSGINHNLVQVSCYDSDPGDMGNMEYEITRGNEDGVITIETQSGLVRLAAPVDIDNSNGADFYLLTLQCVDMRLPQFSDTAILIVQVVSYNEFFPDPGSDYVAFVSESQPLGTRIIQINGTDRDAGLAGVLTYSLAINAWCPDNFFIDSVSGSIYLVRPLDYEEEDGTQPFYCIVQVWDSELPLRPSEADVEIHLVDVNDFAPQCAPSFHFATVPENVVGEDVRTNESFHCRDEDTADLMFTLVDDGSIGFIPFTVRSVGRDFFISVTQPLDYEVQNEYTVHIIASDGNAETNITVYIFVEDINEFVPMFLVPVVSYSLPENSPRGTLVGQVLATDADTSAGGRIRYSLLNGNNTFTIEPQTGQIFLSGQVDCEVSSEFVITVQANDYGSPVSLSSTTEVIVMIEDENDNVPEMPSFLAVTIPENSSLGTALSVIDCTDADASTSIVDLSISTIFEVGNDGIERQLVASVFVIVNDILTLNGTVNYEQARKYRVFVVCTDRGVPSRSTAGTINIDVTSVNEFTPMFNSASQTANVSEATPIGASFLNVSATDEDYGEDGDISYSILDNGVPFFIDSQSGMLFISESLDCEQSTAYHLTVQASDREVTAMQAVVINIVNCSLGNLIPERSVYVAEVLENAASGTSLLTVACRSTRINVDHPLTPVYSIVSALFDRFQVDALSGELTIGSVLPNYELQSSFTLSMECRDPNYSFIVANFVVYISILPLNEHTPIFQNIPTLISVFENATLGSHIFTIEALDEDRSSDGEIIFSITDSIAPVIIDPHTGWLYVTGLLDYETVNLFSFTVHAQDSLQNPLNSRSSSVVVSVSVLDSNDHWPECDRTVYHLVVSPSSDVGSVLTHLNCTDVDEGSNADLDYVMRGNDTSHFETTVNGDFVLVQQFESLHPETLDISIEVQDQGFPPLSTVVHVAVDVQEPYVDLSESSDKHNSLEAEGIRNSVVMTLHDLSTELWENGGCENFLVVMARSVTHYCALLPEACSLVSGCAEFYRRVGRTRRSTDYYSSFGDASVALLSNSTTEVHGSEETILLQVQFYVILPDDASRAPFRQTNFVVPRSALSQIIDQDRTIIEAFVRDSVSPPLTVDVADVWRISAAVLSVILVVILCILILSLIAVCQHKGKKKNKSKVVPINIKPDTIPTSTKSTFLKAVMSTASYTSSNASVSTISLLDTEEHTSMENNGRGSCSQHDMSEVEESVKSQSGCDGLPAHDEDAYLDNFPFTPTRTNPRKPPVHGFSAWTMSGVR